MSTPMKKKAAGLSWITMALLTTTAARIHVGEMLSASNASDTRVGRVLVGGSWSGMVPFMTVVAAREVH